MYDEFEKYLLGEFNINYWYDEGVNIAQDMIYNFKDNDWEHLLRRLSEQNIE